MARTRESVLFLSREVSSLLRTREISSTFIILYKTCAKVVGASAGGQLYHAVETEIHAHVQEMLATLLLPGQNSFDELLLVHARRFEVSIEMISQAIAYAESTWIPTQAVVLPICVTAQCIFDNVIARNRAILSRALDCADLAFMRHRTTLLPKPGELSASIFDMWKLLGLDDAYPSMGMAASTARHFETLRYAQFKDESCQFLCHVASFYVAREEEMLKLFSRETRSASVDAVLLGLFAQYDWPNVDATYGGFVDMVLAGDRVGLQIFTRCAPHEEVVMATSRLLCRFEDMARVAMAARSNKGDGISELALLVATMTSTCVELATICHTLLELPGKCAAKVLSDVDDAEFCVATSIDRILRSEGVGSQDCTERLHALVSLVPHLLDPTEFEAYFRLQLVSRLHHPDRLVAMTAAQDEVLVGMRKTGGQALTAMSESIVAAMFNGHAFTLIAAPNEPPMPLVCCSFIPARDLPEVAPITSVRTLPSIVEIVVNSAQAWWEKDKPGASLYWPLSLTTCSVKLSNLVDGGHCMLYMDAAQFALLSTVANHPIHYDSLSHATGLDLFTLTELLCAFGGGNGKQGIMGRDNNGNFHLNPLFRPPSIDVDLTVSLATSRSASRPFRKGSCEAKISQPFQIDAALVRVMKCAKSLARDELTRRARGFLAPGTMATEIDKRIQSLIARDYFEENQINPLLLAYIP